MTKADLVDQVAVATGLTKKDIALVIDKFLEAIKDALADHDNIEVRRFGTFKVKVRKSRKAHNPRNTSQTVVVPEKVVPVFKPSKFLKDRVNWTHEGDESGIP